MTEGELQSKLLKHCRAEGYIATKLMASNAGWPDVLVILPNGWACFLECKTDKGKLSDVQKHIIKQIEQRGCPVMVCKPSTFESICGALSTLASGDKYVKKLLKNLDF